MSGLRKVFGAMGINADRDIRTASGEAIRKLAQSLGIDPNPHQNVVIDSIGHAAFHERVGSVPPRPMVPTDWSGGLNSNPIDDIRAALKLGANQIYGSMNMPSKRMSFVSPSFSTKYKSAKTVAEAAAQQPAFDAMLHVWCRYVQKDATMDEVAALVLHYCGHQFESQKLISVWMEPSSRGAWCNAVVQVPDSTIPNYMIVALDPREPKPDKILWRSKLLTPSERAEAHTALDTARRSPLETDDDADRTAQ